MNRVVGVRWVAFEDRREGPVGGPGEQLRNPIDQIPEGAEADEMRWDSAEGVFDGGEETVAITMDGECGAGEEHGCEGRGDEGDEQRADWPGSR